MKDRIRIKGMVTVRVLDKDGNVKRRGPGWFRRLFKMQGRVMEYRHHNIVTKEGDALIADALLASPLQTKVASSSGYIQIGNAWTGNSVKTNTRCNNPHYTIQALDSGYPVLKAAWGNDGDTTVIYRATYAAGDLVCVGINEACLLNGNGSSAKCLAYAQITPSVSVTSSDTLQVVWEITILGQ